MAQSGAASSELPALQLETDTPPLNSRAWTPRNNSGASTTSEWPLRVLTVLELREQVGQQEGSSLDGLAGLRGQSCEYVLSRTFLEVVLESMDLLYPHAPKKGRRRRPFFGKRPPLRLPEGRPESTSSLWALRVHAAERPIDVESFAPTKRRVVFQVGAGQRSSHKHLPKLGPGWWHAASCRLPFFESLAP